MRLWNFRQTTLRGAMLRKQRKRLVCLKGPSLGYVRARSLLPQVPQLQLGTPFSEYTTRTPSLFHFSWNSSFGQDITTCDPESTSQSLYCGWLRQVCDSTKIEEFYTARKQLPTIDRLFAVPLHERLRTHKVFFYKKNTQCFHLDYHKFSIKSYVLDVY